MDSAVATYSSIREKLLSGHLNCSEMTERFISRISEHRNLNAFLCVLTDRALRKARSVDEHIREGTAGKLAGMVVAVKDNLAIHHFPTTCGSRMLERYISGYDATVIRKLDSEDAILIGKTNMDEFGMGSTTENSAFGPVRNPYGSDRIPGGSSGGSAVSVASGMAMAALGTDTGGSVRQPASHCAVLGLRPTYGRVSRYGLVAYASSLDTIGCLTHSAEDCCRLFDVISGKDPLDATSSDRVVEDCLSMLNRDIKGLRIGLPKEYFGPGLDHEVCDALRTAIQLMEEGGAEIRSVELPYTDYGIAAYYLICTAEASSNLARYDGVRYGLHSMDADRVEDLLFGSRTSGFGSEVKRRIMLGTYVLSAGYYDAYYLKAQKVRTLIQQDFEKAFEACDVIVGPTAPTTACKLGEMSGDPLHMYLSDIYTVTAPLAGLPAVSVPIGKDTDGLPIGMQITGMAFTEGRILSIAHWIEKHSSGNGIGPVASGSSSIRERGVQKC